MKRLFLFFLLPLTLFADSTLLSSKDVHKIMNNFFEYHVDNKEISAVIIERSLKIFLEQFDASHAYLLEKESDPFLKPTAETLQQTLNEYKKDRFSIYYTMNEEIQKSIVRARNWREQWEGEPLVLIAEAKELISSQEQFSKTSPQNIADLRERHKHLLLMLISLQMRQNERSMNGKEDKLVALCEKQLRVMENPYLGLDEEGNTQPEEKLHHHLIMQTIKALARSLDAHTAYYSPEEALAMKVQLEKGMCGIGVVLHESIDGVEIVDILEGGPAAKAGAIKKGDRIVEIDGKSVTNSSFSTVLELLRGPEGSAATLGIVSNEVQKIRQVKLTRSMITIEEKRVDTQLEPFGDGYIGKITLYSFYEGEGGISSEKDIKKAIEEMKSKGPLYGLVLDMRDNTGGFLSQAVKVSGLFISSGVVVISKYSNGSMKYYRAVDGTRIFDGPMVVLISRGSASATEIVAGCLQDYGVALVAGDAETYGKGTIQHQTVTNDKTNSFFKVTVGRYYTVSGKSTQITGVKSDILIPTELQYEKMGEAFLDFPLAADTVPPAFDDRLTDVDPYVRKWFSKFYLPALQPKITTWKEMQPQLQSNSALRQENNKNYCLFMQKIKKETDFSDKRSYGCNDLQLEEATDIVKDMILLSH